MAIKIILMQAIRCKDVDIQAENDEEAIDKADTESDMYPILICMDLYREDGSRVKHWGK